MPEFPGSEITAEETAHLADGFFAIESAPDISAFDLEALLHEGAVFARLVRPEGYDLVIFPDGVLAGPDAPEGGPWRLASGLFAEAARRTFAKHHLRATSIPGRLDAAIFASRAGLAKEAAGLLSDLIEETPPQDPAHADALFLLHEIQRELDAEAAIRNLARLVEEHPDYAFVRKIGFWRLAGHYNRRHLWPEYLALYRGPGKTAAGDQSEHTKKRLEMIERVMGIEGGWLADPKGVNHKTKKIAYRAYEILGDYESALAWVDRALETSLGDRWGLLAGKGRCLMKLRRFEDAEKTFKDILADERNFYSQSGKVFEFLMELYQAQARNDDLRWASEMHRKHTLKFQKEQGGSPLERGEPRSTGQSADEHAPGR